MGQLITEIEIEGIAPVYFDINFAGPYPDEAVETVFREIMSASLALESPLTVAIADEYARRAARRRFGSAARLRDEDDATKVVDAVVRGWAAYGVLASPAR